MRRRHFLAAAMTLVLLAAVDSGVDVPRITRALISRDRPERLAAIQEVAQLQELPESLINPVISFIRVEFAQSLVEDIGTSGVVRKPTSMIPLAGDEVSLARIKANPQDYIGKTFHLCGGFKISNYYNYGYSESSKNFYSFQFWPVSADMKLGVESAHLYLPRSLGRNFAEYAIRVDEKSGNAALMSVRCTVDDSVIGRDFDAILSMIRIEDWQFFDAENGTWKAWQFDGVKLGYDVLRRAGLQAVGALVGIILSDQVYQDEVIDELFRAGADAAIRGMNLDARRAAYERLSEGAIKSRLPVARRHANSLCIDLLSGEEKSRHEPVAKPIDPSIRAETMLRSAMNLEKAGKIPGALSFYRQITKDFPGTPQAQSAEERIEVLDRR